MRKTTIQFPSDLQIDVIFVPNETNLATVIQFLNIMKSTVQMEQGFTAYIDNFIVTENGDFLVTEDGTYLTWI